MIKDVVDRFFEIARDSVIENKTEFPYPEMVESLIGDVQKDLENRFKNEEEFLEFLAQTSVVMYLALTSAEAEQFMNENAEEFF